LSLHDSSSSSILLSDGGVSTHLEDLLKRQDLGFEHRSLWSSSLLLTEPGRQTILQGHTDWLEAGSDVLTTVTYQCHYGVAGQDLVVSQEKMDQMLRWGVELAKAARDKQKRPTFVVASCGCYGAALADGSEYTGKYKNIDRQGLIDFHCRKAQVLLDQHPDGLAVETVPSIEECHAICDMLSSSSVIVSPSVACWVSLACQNGHLLNDGTPLSEALQLFREKDPKAEQIHAIGINCCDTLHISSLLETLTRDMATKGPRRGIVFYPNSGEEWDAEKETWREGTGCTSQSAFVQRLMHAVQVIEKTWKAHAPTKSTMPKLIIGGCCRTSPRTIMELRQAVDSRERQKQATKAS
jgi:homocysteine S-methyltransferase